MDLATKLAIICTCGGVLIGILVSLAVFFGVRWFKRRSDLEVHSKDNRFNHKNGNAHGRGLGLDSSASVSDSVVVPLPDLPAKSLWSNHHNKDRNTSVSGIPNYLYK